MQKIRPLQCGSRYAINGEGVTAVQVKTMGVGLLSGTRIVHLAGNARRYRLTQWPDGTIYRVQRVSESTPCH